MSSTIRTFFLNLVSILNLFFSDQVEKKTIGRTVRCHWVVRMSCASVTPVIVNAWRHVLDDMTSPKGSYYTTQLFIALTAGEWLSETPSKGSRRGGLSWSELLRKFRKHCPDAHGMPVPVFNFFQNAYFFPKDIADIALHTQALSLLLLRPQEATPEALDGDHTQPDEPLALGAECLLCEEYRDEAFAGYQALQNLTKDEVFSRVTLSVLCLMYFTIGCLSCIGLLCILSRSFFRHFGLFILSEL